MFGRGEEKPRRTNAIAFIGLLMVLGHFYPWCMFWFQVILIFSLIQLPHQLVVIVEVASVLPPFRSPVSQQANPLLAILSNRFLLIFISCGAELFYLFLYLDVFYEGPSLLDLPLLSILTAATFPAALLYSLSSFIRLIPLIKSYPSSVKNDEKKQ